MFLILCINIKGKNIVYKRAVWLTDLHLDLITPESFTAFLDQVIEYEPDLVWLTGDIDEKNLNDTLRQMATRLQVPIYFVLGNHDYYRKTIANVRSAVEELSRQSRLLTWMPSVDFIEITPEIGLVGHDGWADGGYGNFLNSPVLLQDYLLIRDLHNTSGESLLKKLQLLGQDAAAHVRRVLPKALERFQHVILLTHVPPFREATWYEGNIPSLEDPYLPHFSCKAVGDALLEIVPQYPTKQVTVLCGHTHSSGQTQILDNLIVLTGAAEYGYPRVQHVFELEW